MRTKLDRLKAEFNDLCVDWQNTECYSLKEANLAAQLKVLSDEIAQVVQEGGQ